MNYLSESKLNFFRIESFCLMKLFIFSCSSSLILFSSPNLFEIFKFFYFYSFCLLILVMRIPTQLILQANNIQLKHWIIEMKIASLELAGTAFPKPSMVDIAQKYAQAYFSLHPLLYMPRFSIQLHSWADRSVINIRRIPIK